eukprot:m51a1_g747 putative C-tail anchored protein (724) ;mRNA; f:512662-514934
MRRALVLVLVTLALSASAARYHDARPSLARRLADAALALPSSSSPALGAPRIVPNARPCLRGAHSWPWWCIDLEVVFMVLPATGSPSERKGTLLMAQGGPGVVAHSRAAIVAASLPREVRAAFDVVLMDQRGVGWSCGLWCPSAATRYTLAASSAENASDQSAAARAFASDCVASLANESANETCIVNSSDSLQEQLEAVLEHAGTSQAAEDFEMFVLNAGEALGELWVYGRSYGTQLVQHYAAAHPQRIAGAVLDCPVDAASGLDEFYAEEVAALRHTVSELERWCVSSTDCRRDVCPHGDCTGLFSRLLRDLRSRRGSVSRVAFPKATSDRWMTEWRPVRPWHAEHAAINLMYSRTERALLMRSIAAYTRDGTLLPMMRWFYASSGINGSTLAPISRSTDPSDSGFSSAAFNAIDANDYGAFFGEGDGDARSGKVLALAKELAGDFESVVMERLPYAYMRPETYSPPRRSPYLRSSGFPVLIVTSDVDPATPHVQGVRLWRTARNGHLLVQEGGDHSMYLSSGFSCVDKTVTEFLLSGSLPTGGKTTCRADAPVEGYTPLSEPKASKYESALDALVAFDVEVHHLPELLFRPSGSAGQPASVRVGCDYGGGVVVEDRGGSVAFAFESCSLIKGMSISGSGLEYSRSVSLNVTMGGYWQGGVSYRRNSGGALIVAGTPRSRHERNARILAGVSFACGGVALLVLALITSKLLRKRGDSAHDF